jgi:hypothetical protein
MSWGAVSMTSTICWRAVSTTVAPPVMRTLAADPADGSDDDR